jgi:outer membrane protein assembly factor BamB
LAGTGRKGLRDSRQTDPLALDLRSPWDLALDGNQLYIAMAGDHRIWRLDLVRDRLAPFAGSGHEGIDNGDLADASFSQPSGLALRDGKLYVADPEASAVREIDLAQGRVSTLAGRGLFDFGDRDGPLVTARLQHALAVLSWGEDQLLIADTYNHKLKRLDLNARRLATLLGDGRAGSPHGDLKPGLDEPGGLARLGDQVLIADTNNGRILAFDPATGKARVWEPRES